MGKIDPIALHIIREAKRKHFMKRPCIYCNTLIKPPQVFCNERCANLFSEMMVRQNETTN